MKPSPLMQQLIERLAAKHEVDLSEPDQYLRLSMPNCPIQLVIETTHDRRLMVSCYGKDETDDADPEMLFEPGYPDGWLPVELLYSPQEWETFSQETSLSISPNEVDLADLTEYWASRLVEQGWLDHGRWQEEPKGRLPGCQSTNHTVCYGELWQCESCGKTVCCNEGTTDHPELCDDCWVQQYHSTTVIG